MTDFSFLIAPMLAFFVAAGSPGPATLFGYAGFRLIFSKVDPL